MNGSIGQIERLRFLLRVSARQASHLQGTDRRLFSGPLTAETLHLLDSDPAFAERVEAFASRFARLQDTLGDKLLPALLGIAGETPRSAIENLDRAEKLGWIASADHWMSLRKLRNQMVHEYVEDPVVLADALNLGHESVPALCAAAGTLAAAAERLLAL